MPVRRRTVREIARRARRRPVFPQIAAARRGATVRHTGAGVHLGSGAGHSRGRHFRGLSRHGGVWRNRANTSPCRSGRSARHRALVRPHGNRSGCRAGLPVRWCPGCRSIRTHPLSQIVLTGAPREPRADKTFVSIRSAQEKAPKTISPCAARARQGKAFPKEKPARSWPASRRATSRYHERLHPYHKRDRLSRSASPTVASCAHRSTDGVHLRSSCQQMATIPRDAGPRRPRAGGGSRRDDADILFGCRAC